MRTVLYACTNLAYDQIFTPVAMTPGVDFVLFADRKPRFVRGWQWRPYPPRGGRALAHHDQPLRQVLPAPIFPEAEISIYVDANTLMLADLTPLIAEFRASGADIGLFPHKQRFDICEEFAFARKVGKVPAADAAKGAAQLAFYRAEGLPDGHLFTENAIIFRRHGGGQSRARGGDGPLVAADADLHPPRPAEPALRADEVGAEGEALGLELQVREPLLPRYLHRRGALSDLNVILKNKRCYNRFYDVTCGAILGTWQR